MNYYGPAQRKSDGRWDYTARNDRDEGAHPIGYCHAFRDWTLEEAERYGASATYLEAHRATADKHHTDGHATKEEACECYKQYLLDHRTRYDAKLAHSQEKCCVCGAWTQGMVTVEGSRTFVLCDEHRDREHLEPILTVGESFGTM